MQNKVSINATDILDYRQKIKQKSYSFDFERKNLADENSRQSQRKYSEVPAGKQSNQYSFLSRIRVSGGKDRYNKECHTSNAEKRHNSMQATSQNKNYDNQNKCETLEASQNHPHKLQIVTYSPFSEKQHNYKIGQGDLSLSKKIKQKLHLDNLQDRSLTKNSPGRNKILKNSNMQQKFYAKMLQFTTEFDKTKLFQQQEQEQLKLKIKQEKLSPYQLSIRRKNLNLIKMKLNSLGEKADDEEKNKCLQLSRLCNESQSKKLKHWRLKRKQEEGSTFGNKKQMWPHKYTTKIGSSKQWGEWSAEGQNKFDLNTKTIQIRQIPRTKKRYSDHQSLSSDKNDKNLKFRKLYQQTLVIF